MGYTGTTNYGFQKPEKSNSFTVDDLNNALDKADEIIKGVDDTVKNVDDESITEINSEVDSEKNFKIVLTRKNKSLVETKIKISDLGSVNLVEKLPSNPVSGTVYAVIPTYGKGYIDVTDLKYYMDNEIPDTTIYSIIYDKSKASNSYGCLEYADFCEGFEPMIGGNGNADEGDWKQGNTTLFDKIEVGYFNNGASVGYINKIGDVWTKVSKSNISFNGYYNFTKIPKIYQKVESLDSNRKKLSISLAPFDGATIHPSFIRDGVEKPYVYIARTLGTELTDGASGSQLSSEANKSPINLDRSAFRSYAKYTKTDGTNITSYHDRDLVNKFYLFGFKDWNSQKALGAGVTSTSAKVNTGGTAGKSWMYGTTDDSEQISFLGLEDWWGNLSQWLDDYWLTGGTIYVGTNSTPTDNTSGKTAIGSFAGSTGNYPLKAKFGLNDTFISEASGGSSGTGMCDNQSWNNSGTNIACAGGSFSDRLNAGAFCLYSNYSSSYGGSLIGARLTYKP